MITAIVILSLLVITLSFTTWNLLRKNEIAQDIIIGYSQYLSRLTNIIQISDKKLKELDAKGSFESDDEIGFFFESVKELQGIMNEFQVKDIE